MELEQGIRNVGFIIWNWSQLSADSEWLEREKKIFWDMNICNKLILLDAHSYLQAPFQNKDLKFIQKDVTSFAANEYSHE